MPERVTKEERMVSLAIEKARIAKEKLSDKKRMNIEPTQVNPVDTTVEVQKITRPKVQDASKITNQTQDKEGYGLAGESLKKAKFSGPPEKNPYVKTKARLEARMIDINIFLKRRNTLNEKQTLELKEKVKRALQDIDEFDKYNPVSISRKDEKDLRVKD